MFLSKTLTKIGKKLNDGVNNFSPEEVNAGIDALGLPFGFKYAKPFLFKAFKLLPTVEKTGDEDYRVPSESAQSRIYNVSLNPLSCECPAFHRFKMTPHPYCKHIAAALLKDQEVDGMSFEEFMDRWDDGNYKWPPKSEIVAARSASSAPPEEPEPDDPERLVVIFSSSQLDTYTRCPAQYYFRRVAKIPDSDVRSSSLVFDSSLKAAIYAAKGFEPDPEIPFEDKWRPELDIAADAFSEGKSLDVVFAETFQWVCDEVQVEWKKDGGLKPSSFDEDEFAEMQHRGGVLACMFDEQFNAMKAEPLVKMRTTMVDSETGLIVQTNGTPASVQCSFDLIGASGVIYKLKTSSKSISKLTYDWTIDLQRYVYEQINGEAPAGVKIVNLVRTKKPKMQVLDAPEPRTSRTLAICESVIASINAQAFYPNPKNLYGCEKCDYVKACDAKW